MLKYLNSRECPKCRFNLILMLLRFNPRISTIHGVCGHCHHSMKWQLIQGNVFTTRSTRGNKPSRALRNNSR
jgi:hypothetical protein